MGQIKAILHQVGLSTTISQNFTITAENADGTLRIRRGVQGSYGTTPLMIDANDYTLGTTPPAGDRTKKLATTDFFTSEFMSSFGSSGWQKFPSGLIIQWGVVGLSSAPAGTTIGVFPIPFPVAMHQIVVTHDNPLDSTLAYGVAAGVSTTQFRVNALAINTSNFTMNPGYSISLRWIAVGN